MHVNEPRHRPRFLSKINDSNFYVGRQQSANDKEILLNAEVAQEA
jgi:hypothetical protein